MRVSQFKRLVALLALAVALLAAALSSPPAGAHEMRPAYLELQQTAEGDYTVLWKVPAFNGMRLGLHVRLPENCAMRGEPIATVAGEAYLERWRTSCTGGLGGREIAVDGLRVSLTDVLARVSSRDGSVQLERLTPESPAFRVTGATSTLHVAWTYFALGIEHILFGFDHLLFVFALILLIGDRWMLLKTITAFTVAHSITLAGAALGAFTLPQKPVEATIALSIAFVASELVKAKPGERRLSQACPWVVAFAFGLLHGFGFAGALNEVGLPTGDIPTALLTFNLGVEAGQLLFVAAVLATFAMARRLLAAPRPLTTLAGGYAIGITACIWLVDRIMTFSAS